VGSVAVLKGSAHREVPVKVTAWVDEGVAPLVAALNEFRDVMTLDSCEHDPDRGAYVLFYSRHAEPLRFVAELAASLSPYARAADYSLRIEWRAGTDEPLLELACPPDQVEPLAQLLSAFRIRARFG
jgi:hypothetical protein